MLNGKPLSDPCTIKCFYFYNKGHKKYVSSSFNTNVDGSYLLELRKLSPHQLCFFEITNTISGNSYVVDSPNGAYYYKDLSEFNILEVFPQAVIQSISIDSTFNIYKPASLVIKTAFKEYNFDVTYNSTNSSYDVNYNYTDGFESKYSHIKRSNNIYLENGRETIIDYYFLKSDGSASPTFALKKTFNAGPQSLLLTI